MARTTAKKKLPSYEKIDPKKDTYEVYDLITKAVKTDHKELQDARIGAAWRFGWKRNKDGQLILGKLKKVPELDKRFAQFDFILILNHEAFQAFDAAQRRALIDHYLCYGNIAEDPSGNPKQDAFGRQAYRTVKPDVVGFIANIKRHGCYLSDLQDFCLAAIASKRPPQPDLPLMSPETLPMPSAADTKKKGKGKKDAEPEALPATTEEPAAQAGG